MGRGAEWVGAVGGGERELVNLGQHDGNLHLSELDRQIPVPIPFCLVMKMKRLKEEGTMSM